MKRRRTLTKPHEFCRFPDGMLFSVNAGMPVDIALEHASCLLGCVDDLATALGQGEGRGSEIHAIQYLAEMAKALVDASSDGLYDVEGGQ